MIKLITAAKVDSDEDQKDLQKNKKVVDKANDL